MSTSPRGRAQARASSSQVSVLSVPPNLPITVRFLGKVLGLDTHWRSGRSIPCPGALECPSTLHKSGVIWKGYAAVEQWEETNRVWRAAVLEVTETLEELLRGRDLRGETWNLFRAQKNGRTDPVLGIFCERVPETRLSPVFDPTPVLLRLFHVSELQLGKSNPLPARIVLEPVPGDAPKLPEELTDQATPDNDPERLKAAAEVWRAFRAAQRSGSNSANANARPTDRNGTHNAEHNGR